jgi:putative ABC transport system permease protein
VNRITRVELQAKNLLNSVYLKESPKELLLDYRRTTNLLSFLLSAFSVPIAALFLAYINLVSGVIIERQRNEIAVLRSRGATLLQIVGITLLEGVLLVALALVTGVPTSIGVIFLMGKTRSFLDFSLPASLRLDVTTLSLVFGGCAGLLVLTGRVTLVCEAARHTIITYKQEQARSLRAPWWQRAGLDILLFIPAIYGTYLLRKQGSLLPGATVTVNDPFQNPLLLLVPALGIFACTLFLLRLLPGTMAGIAWVATRTKSVGLLLASRHLSRTPSF